MWFTIAATAILAGLVYILGIVTYRLTLHPLARYPGPFLGRFTDWYSVIRSASGDRHVHFLALHDKYGPFVRFGPNRISVNTVEGLHKIYGVKANTQKSSYYNVFNQVFKGDSSLTTIDHELHLKKKRTVSSALSESSIRAMEGLVLRNIRKFTSSLHESEQPMTGTQAINAWGSPKNMSKLANYLSFDIMGDICFSSPFGMLDRPDNRYILDVLPQGVNALNMSGWMPGILRLKIGNILFSKHINDMKRYEAFANQQTRRRLAMGNDAKDADVYSHLLRANEASKDNPLFSEHDLVGESSLLITGGSDTTATAISATFFYLMHNSAAYERLQDEIHALFASVDEIVGGAVLSSCRWLRACIDEAMRMSPGVPGLLPRQALAGGVPIGGHIFPEGVDLGVCHYAIHHNEEYYPDSFCYRPERWLTGSHSTGSSVAGGDHSLVHAAFCPFSIGPRGCVGKSMAMKELMITIARVVWLYDARLGPGEEHRGEGGSGKGYGRHRVGEYQMRDMFVSKTDGPVLQFRHRIRREPSRERGS